MRNPDDDAKVSACLVLVIDIDIAEPSLSHTHSYQVAFLKKIAADAEASERFHLFAAELLEKGSFDKAMNDAKFVLHTASPFFIRSVRLHFFHLH